MATKSPSTRDSAMAPDIGISAKSATDVSRALAEVLADTYTLLVKTHVYHWNVVGPLFLPLHELTEQHYKDMFEAADHIAERIRALGQVTPLSFEQMMPKAGVEEETVNRAASAMVHRLVADHEQLAKRLRIAALAANEADDLVTADLLTGRLAFHEKAIWMLKAMTS